MKKQELFETIADSISLALNYFHKIKIKLGIEILQKNFQRMNDKLNSAKQK